jgi:hypothetical protein
MGERRGAWKFLSRRQETTPQYVELREEALELVPQVCAGSSSRRGSGAFSLRAVRNCNRHFERPGRELE